MPIELNDGRDGPWHVSGRFVVVVTGAGRDPGADDIAAELTHRLQAAGLPVVRRSELSPGETTDVLIVDPGVSIEAAAVAELRRVAEFDPMIALVSPRLDRGGPGAFPNGPRRLTDAQRRQAAEILSRNFPALAYVALPEVCCLYAKGCVLEQVRPAGPIGTTDWEAYALSISHSGFRSALANHAIAASDPSGPAPGEAPARQQVDRAARLDALVPGARAALVHADFATTRAAERLLAGLIGDPAGRRSLAFDLSHVGPQHSGTSDLARILIERAAAAWTADWDVAVVATAETFGFHFAGRAAPRRVDPADPERFAAVIRIGQPFSWKELDHAVHRAPVIVAFLLDTIGLDCILIAPDELDALWRFMLAEADGLLFNSAFTERQFDRRFGSRAGQPRCASLHSLAVDDYRIAAPLPPDEGGPILIIGNAFPHKHVEETARLLAATRPDTEIVALGLRPGRVEGVLGLPSGGLTEATMAELYGRARVVVYPSFYEGFGFPLLQALAHRRPILVRPLPPFDEIAAGLPDAANIHRYADDADLLRLLDQDLRWIEAPPQQPEPRNWDVCTADLRQVLEAAVKAACFDRVVRRLDFMQGRLDWVRRKRFLTLAAFGGADPIERAAGFAGRMAQHTVQLMGRVPGGRHLFGAADRLVRMIRRR